jgi:hypothetical protein
VLDVDVDSDPQASPGLVCGPVEVDDLLGGKQVDAGFELSCGGQGVGDLVDQVLRAGAPLRGAGDCEEMVQRRPHVQGEVPSARPRWVVFVASIGRGPTARDCSRLLGTGAGQVGAACDGGER